MKARLTEAFVERAVVPEGVARMIWWDLKQPGFGLMVTRNGHKSFVVQYRAGRRSRRMHLHGASKLDAARDQAKAILGDVAKGRALRQVIDPLEDRRRELRKDRNTLRSVINDYLSEADGLRSIEQRRDIFDRLVVPRLGARQIEEIGRRDIKQLLDGVAEKNGPVQADMVLALVRRVFNWHAARSDDYRSPIVRGMARTKPKERARSRVLTDDEIRAIWAASKEMAGPFGMYVRFTLLAACRRNESARMRRCELAYIRIDGTTGDYTRWTLPAARAKPKVDIVLPLSKAAQCLLDDLPKTGDYLFTTNGQRPITSFSFFKRLLDEASGVRDWTLHDLRRTARTLLSRAGVSPDHAERCLGHVIAGIRGTYDRFEFEAEKREAFEKLAALIQRIIDPQSNVVAFPAAS
jgi:integrase